MLMFWRHRNFYLAEEDQSFKVRAPHHLARQLGFVQGVPYSLRSEQAKPPLERTNGLGTFCLVPAVLSMREVSEALCPFVFQKAANVLEATP
ncbi:hypothetical protein ACLB2K_004466 [Fragaria x ananassa]